MVLLINYCAGFLGKIFYLVTQKMLGFLFLFFMAGFIWIFASCCHFSVFLWKEILDFLGEISNNLKIRNAIKKYRFIFILVKTSEADDRRRGSDDRKCSDNGRVCELFAINLFFIFFFLTFFQFFVPADFYFPVDMSDIRRYIRYSPVF